MTTGDKGAAPPPGLDGKGLRIGVVRARWNAPIVDRLAQGVGRGLAALGVDPADVVDAEVPGSFELPMGARILASSHAIPGTRWRSATKRSRATSTARITASFVSWRSRW